MLTRRDFLRGGLVLAAGALCGCTRQVAEPTPEFVLTYAENQPDGYPTTEGAQRFAALVQERTEGRVRVQVKTGGLYGTEEEVWDQLAIGGIDFARLSLSVMAEDLPQLNVLQLPYLYRDSAHMWRVLDGAIGESFLQAAAQKEMVGLSWYDAGARSFYATRPIRSLEDLRGKTVRVQDSPVVLDLIRLLGATPVTSAYSEVYAAFETGQIDAAENNWPAYYSMNHYKVAPYYTTDEHSRVPELQLASGKTWAKLPANDQAILRACARESARYERVLWAEQEVASRKAARAAGCHEIRLAAEELEAFRQLVQPLYQQYGGAYRELIREIEEA